MSTIAYEHLEKQFWDDVRGCEFKFVTRLTCVVFLYLVSMWGAFYINPEYGKHIPDLCWLLYFVILCCIIIGNPSYRVKMNEKASLLSKIDYEKYISVIDKYDELRLVKYEGKFIRSEIEKTLKELVYLLYANKTMYEPLKGPEEQRPP